MNPADDYVRDNDELVFTGKRIREYRDLCRNEGYKQALEDVLNLPVKDFTGDFIKQIYNLKKELEGKE
jgi:5'-deoxynucleotidase YfbR-like HD superfamily hydrolase